MRIRLAAVALASCAVARPAAALQPLQAFVDSARDHNPDALEATANASQQQAQADLALGRVLPGVSARGSLSRNQYDFFIDFAPGQRITIVPLHQWDAAATVTVPLIDLAGFARVASARTSAAAAARQVQSTRLLVQAQVAQGYYQLVADLALLSASQEALGVSRESLRLADTRYNAGVGPVLDVDRARADVEQQNQQVAAAQLQVALAARALESGSGLTPDTSSTVPLDEDLHPEQPLETFQSGLSTLPSVAAAADNTHAAEQQAAAQRFGYLPVIAGNFVERGTSAPGFVASEWTWQASLSASWALVFTIPAGIRAQNAVAAAARARELRARLQARDSIHRQWETVSAAIVRSRSARAGKEAASQAAEQAKNRYQAGTITQLELLQAQRDLFTADVSRIQADADLGNARAQLRLASGTLLGKAGAQ